MSCEDDETEPRSILMESVEEIGSRGSCSEIEVSDDNMRVMGLDEPHGRPGVVRACCVDPA